MIEKTEAGRFVRGVGREHWVVPPAFTILAKLCSIIYTISLDGSNLFTRVEMSFLNVYRLVQFIYVDPF